MQAYEPTMIETAINATFSPISVVNDVAFTQTDGFDYFLFD